MRRVDRKIPVDRRFHHIVNAAGETLDSAAPADAVVNHHKLGAGLHRRLDAGEARIDRKGDAFYLISLAGKLYTVV